MIKSFIGRIRGERLYTITQTFPACDFEGIELTNEPVIDPQTHRRVQLTKVEAEKTKSDYPQGRVVRYKGE